MPRVAVIFADGFEDIEAIACVDVLRRASCDVIMTGLDTMQVSSSHGIRVSMDTTLDQLTGELDALVLPGGLPGAENLKNSDALCDLVRNTHAAGKVVAAICAAPMVLERAGISTGIKATCYPGFEDQVGSAEMTGARVERDGTVITGNGPGSAIEFALEILNALQLEENSAALRAGMQVYAP